MSTDHSPLPRPSRRNDPERPTPHPVSGPPEAYPGDRAVRVLTHLLAELRPGARVSVYAPNPYRRRFEVVTDEATTRVPVVVEGRSVLLGGLDATSRLHRRAVLATLSGELLLGEDRVSNSDAALADDLLGGLREDERYELEEVVGPGRTSERTLPAIVAIAREVRGGATLHDALLAADARTDPVRAELTPGERLLLRDLVGVAGSGVVGPVDVDVLRVHAMRELDDGARPLRVEVRRPGATRTFLLSRSGVANVGALVLRSRSSVTDRPYLPGPEGRELVEAFVELAFEDHARDVLSNGDLRRFLAARDLLDGWEEWSFARDASTTHAHPEGAVAALAFTRDVEGGAPPVWAAHRAEAAHRERGPR